MQFTSELVTDDVVERLFNLSVNGERIPGVIWTLSDSSESHPLVLIGHGGSQHKKFASLVSRVHKYVRDFGFAVVAIDAPGHGERTPSEQAAQFVAELQKKMAEGQPVSETVAREMARLALQAVPEWQATLDAVQALDYIGTDGLVGYWGVSMGGAIGVPLVAAEPRIAAAVLGLAGLPPNHKPLADAAAKITIPVEFVLQWNDEIVSRDSSFALFDAIGSREKTLHANPGGHTRIPSWESESWERFFNRHLKAKRAG
ncbi:MAG: alpha/beta hydrolase [Nitrososphaera sp.]